MLLHRGWRRLGLVVAFAMVAGCDDDPPPVGPDAGTPGSDAAQPGDAADGGVVDANSEGGAADVPGPTTSCTAVPTHTLRTAYFPSTHFAASGAPMFVVPNGFAFTGTVTVPPLPGGSSIRIIARDANGHGYLNAKVQSKSPTTFAFELIAPAGAYDLRYEFYGAGPQRFKYEHIDLCGDLTAEVAFAPLGPLTEISVALTGIDQVGPRPPGSSTRLNLTSPDRTLIIEGFEYLTAIKLSVPADFALFAAKVVYSPTGKYDDSMSVAVAPLSGAAPYVVAVPPLVTLSGQIVDASGALSPRGGYILCAEYSPGATSPVAVGIWEQGGSGFTGAVRTHTEKVRKGLRCTPIMEAEVDVGQGDRAWAGRLRLPYPSPVAAANARIEADTVHDFVVPALGPVIELTARIVDADGQPLPGYQLVPISTVLDQPGLAGVGFGGRSVGSTATGETSVRVLPGTYEVHVELPLQ
jgi:hypothetical protein